MTKSRSFLQKISLDFVDKMKEIASEYGVVSVEGHDVWADKADDATIIIDVEEVLQIMN